MHPKTPEHSQSILYHVLELTLNLPKAPKDIPSMWLNLNKILPFQQVGVSGQPWLILAWLRNRQPSLLTSTLGHKPRKQSYYVLSSLISFTAQNTAETLQIVPNQSSWIKTPFIPPRFQSACLVYGSFEQFVQDYFLVRVRPLKFEKGKYSTAHYLLNKRQTLFPLRNRLKGHRFRNLAKICISLRDLLGASSAPLFVLKETEQLGENLSLQNFQLQIWKS